MESTPFYSGVLDEKKKDDQSWGSKSFGNKSNFAVVFNLPPNQTKEIVKFDANYVPILAQTEPLLSIPEVFLPPLVAGLQQDYLNGCILNLIRNGDLDKLKLSVQKGLHVDRIIRSGKSLLTIAVLEQKPQILTWLLSKGANPNIADNRGYTCLEYACLEYTTSSNNSEILRGLLLCKKISAITKRKACLFIKHASNSQHIDMIKSLSYCSLGLSAGEYKRFVYDLENKKKTQEILNITMSNKLVKVPAITISSQNTIIEKINLEN